MNLIISGDLTTKRNDYCKMMKVRALVISYMFGKMLSDENYKKYVVFRDFNITKIKAYKRATSQLQRELKKESFLTQIT